MGLLDRRKEKDQELRKEKRIQNDINKAKSQVVPLNVPNVRNVSVTPGSLIEMPSTYCCYEVLEYWPRTNQCWTVRYILKTVVHADVPGSRDRPGSMVQPSRGAWPVSYFYTWGHPISRKKAAEKYAFVPHDEEDDIEEEVLVVEKPKKKVVVEQHKARGLLGRLKRQ